MTRVGFIGFGSFSQTRYAVLKSIPDVSLIGFYDPAISENRKGIKSFSNPEDLFSEIDAIIISVPPKLAPSYVINSLNSNLHVFCEKPAAVSLKDLKKIKKYILDDKVLAYGFNHRQHSSIKKIKLLLEENTLGKILWMRGRYGKEVDENYKDSWRCNKKLNGGGILIDQGIHMVDLMNYLSGGFDGVQALLSSNYLNKPGIDDNGFILNDFHENDRSKIVDKFVNAYYLFLDLNESVKWHI